MKKPKKHPNYYFWVNFKPNPFPHTEYTTCRPNSAKPETLWDDLVNFLATEYLDPLSFRWVFRGVTRASHALESKLERELRGSEAWREKLERKLRRDKAWREKLIRKPQLRKAWTQKLKRIDRQTAEDYLLSQFKKAAHHFIEPSMVPDNTLEWLALMQHYGTPTRLLDFTRSPYVACYFALEKAEPLEKPDPNSKRAIWAFDANWLIQRFFKRIESCVGKAVFTPGEMLGSNFIEEYFNEFYNNNCISAILPIFPPKLNVRLLVQQGLFLCPSAAEISFEKILSSYNDDTKNMHKYVNKIVVEERIRHEVLSELHFMNISRTSLFPGLEGFATSLNHQIYYKSLDELTRLR